MKLKFSTKLLIATILTTSLLGSAYVVYAANPTVRIPLDNLDPLSVPFGGVTTDNGVNIPEGTIELTITKGTALLIPLGPKLTANIARFTVNGTGSFVYTDTSETIVYAGEAVFQGNGRLTLATTVELSMTLTARVTALSKEPGGVPFSYEFVANVYWDISGAQPVQVTSFQSANPPG